MERRSFFSTLGALALTPWLPAAREKQAVWGAIHPYVDALPITNVGTAFSVIEQYGLTIRISEQEILRARP